MPGYIWREPPTTPPWQPQPEARRRDLYRLTLQYSRSDADVSIGSWTTQSGGTTNLYQTVDEAARDDSDYVRSTTDPSADTLILSLQPLGDPGVNNDYVVTIALTKDLPLPTMSLVATLQAGTTDISTGTFSDVLEGFREVTWQLTSAEVDSFRTNGGFADPRIKLVATQS